jgi:hypothetical protein
MGANGTVYEGGFYHGQILLDQEYPMKPPRIIFLTESGRFEIGEPICLSITSHHKETWQPSWDIRLVMTALQVREYKPEFICHFVQSDVDLVFRALWKLLPWVPSAESTLILRLYQDFFLSLVKVGVLLNIFVNFCRTVASLQPSPARFPRSFPFCAEPRLTLLQCGTVRASVRQHKYCIFLFPCSLAPVSSCLVKGRNPPLCSRASFSARSLDSHILAF